MFIVRAQFLFLVLVMLAGWPLGVRSQAGSGTLEVNIKNVKVEGKPAKLSRKRFYLFPGGLKENAALLQRIKAAEITSRDCYYKGMQASDQYLCWLQQENCESPFCRTVEPVYLDAKNKLAVPEFLTAYNKGLTLYKGKTDIARDWLLTNMPDNLVNGYYRQQQKVLSTVLAGLKPSRSSMTDTAAVRAQFIDILFQDGAVQKGKYLISNVLPIEIGGKSYVWTCEKDVEAGKKVILDVSKGGKSCEVTERELKVCAAAACEQSQ